MLKESAQNAAFSGASQLVTLIVLITLASRLESVQFGILSIQLSSATLLSLILTLQFERVYVRVREPRFGNYLVFHLRFFFALSFVAFAASNSFELGPSSVLVAIGMGLAQIALYAAARRGRFKRIWILKAVQALGLCLFVVLISQLSSPSGYWIAFAGSYFFAGCVCIERRTWRRVFGAPLRGVLRRLRFSIGIAFMGLGSLLASSGVREMPVLLAGAMGQPQLAATAGLIMRTVGSPVGLIARSASAVVANFVATRRLREDAMFKLGAIPLAGLAIIFLVALGFECVPALQKYEGFVYLLWLLTPYFLVRAYIGLLGPAIVFFRVQWLDLVSNVLVLGICGLSGLAIWLGLVDFTALPIVMSLSACIFGSLVVWRILIALRPNEAIG